MKPTPATPPQDIQERVLRALADKSGGMKKLANIRRFNRSFESLPADLKKIVNARLGGQHTRKNRVFVATHRHFGG